MKTARSAEGSTMDRLSAIGSPLPSWPARSLASRAADFGAYAPLIQPAAPNPTAAPGDPQRSVSATDQRMMHLISHVDAECFISLLQTMDPMPDDYLARAEYKRRYRKLREALEAPLPPPDPESACLPAK
jgi:hypothetical protein